jgi:putative transposase
MMGLQAIYPKPNTSKNPLKYGKYPYLLNGLNINCPNQVWGTDITYIRAQNSWFYLVAIMDWFSRYVLAWRLSRDLTGDFCREALKEALMMACPEIHNSDQGSQYTAEEYVALLEERDIRVSMDSRGRCFDNIFNERLWRTVKYEEVYLRDYADFTEARDSLKRYFDVYNRERLHQALGYRTPAEVYFGEILENGEKRSTRFDSEALELCETIPDTSLAREFSNKS